MNPREPDDSHRTVIIGRTGEGKSVRALDILSRQNFDEIPWVIIDYKGDDHLEALLKQNKREIKRISLEDKPPKNPGLYYMHPRPILDDKEMEAWLMKVHKQGDIGLFIDEGYAMPNYGNSPGFTLILTQGRSLHIPVICLYQRPVWMSRFAIAQSDFRCLFKLDDERDAKVAKQFVKPAYTKSGNKLGPMELEALPKYHSLWHDVGRGQAAILIPAPERQAILQNFKLRLTPQRKGMFV